MVTPVIQVQDLSKSFGDNSVLRRVSMDVTTGETVVIIGASGSGKTTFLRCLNRLEEPSAGTVLLDGNPVVNSGSENKSRTNAVNLVLFSKGLIYFRIFLPSIM